MLTHRLGNNWIARQSPALDEAIPAAGADDFGLDLGAGLYYVAPTFWLGISSTHLTEVKMDAVSIQTRRHYFVQAGYDWAIKGNKKYVLQPSTLIKSDGTSTQVDLTATFLYNNQVWLGVSYRTEDAIAPLIGYQYELPNKKSMNAPASRELKSQSTYAPCRSPKCWLIKLTSISRCSWLGKA